MEIEKILDDYRNGDEDKRLSLFLTYRELRDDFTRIDQDTEQYEYRPLFFHCWSPSGS